VATLRSEAAPQPALLDRLWTRASSVPIWAWLCGIVAVSAGVEIALGTLIRSPLVFDDELVSWDLARSFAASGHFAVREASTSVYGPITRLYPALIAPAFPLTGDSTRAYGAVKAINAVLMSLAAVPTFFLARRMVRDGLAVVAAALAVAVPSFVYTGMVMTENAAYPAFLFCALAFVRALERPTTTRQAVAVVAIAVSFLIRAQSIALVPALVCSILLLVWLEAEKGGRVEAFRIAARNYRPTWIALAASSVGLVAIQMIRHASPTEILGSYGAVKGATHSASIPRWLLYQLADLDLYVGVAPFAACAVVLPSALRGRYGRQSRIFAVTSASLAAWSMLVVAQVSTTPWGLGRLHERNLFYVVPLLLIVFLLFVEESAQLPRRRKLLAAMIAAALPATLPFGELIRGALVDTLALLPWANAVVSQAYVPIVMTCVAALLASLVLMSPRLGYFAVAVIGLNFLVVGSIARSDAQAASKALAAKRVNQNWIDERVGSDARVAALWVPSSVACARPSQWNIRAYGFWQNEFFNRSVRRTFYVRRPLDDLREDALRISPRTHVLVRANGALFRARYVTVPSGVRLSGTVVGADTQTRTVLYRLAGPISLVLNCGAT